MLFDGLKSMGSSPLTRGKRVRPRVRVFDLGLIPAHAGKTLRSRRAGRRSRAHPRSRGENQRAGTRWSARLGSSPLTRGKLRLRAHSARTGGLIPAHAGKTPRSRVLVSRSAAHPRSRGENCVKIHELKPSEGSSPLTRGKLAYVSEFYNAAGLIPAHAGKTTRGARLSFSPGAHPRSRGENLGADAGLLVREGSSPLTRGKHPPDNQRLRAARLIPAHAGKTPWLGSAGRAVTAHPRSRGENAASLSKPARGRGSSPLTRGKPLDGIGVALVPRLIPAHAGKTP